MDYDPAVYRVDRGQTKQSDGEQPAAPIRQEAVVLDMPSISRPFMEQVEDAVAKGLDRFLSIQHAEGYWVFPLEADTTIPSEYIMLHRFLDREMKPGLKGQLADYIRRRQLPDGGWPLYEDGFADISASVKAYFALKLAGDSKNAPHMVRARRLILSLGGAAKVNIFTRITLALFGQIPWRTTPAMPVEIMLLPKWFFFHLDKVSYWSRTVIVPLLILYAKRPVCRLSLEEGIQELFVDAPDKLRHLDHFVAGKLRKNLFILLDRILKRTEHLIPAVLRRKAVRLAEEWTLRRMQGEGGIGAIYPAMANAVMALKVLGYPDDHPDVLRGTKALDDLLLSHRGGLVFQPCHAPVWDTSLSLATLLEAGLPADHDAVINCINWLFEQQVFVRGDWSHRAPHLEPGGWAFQFENAFYPDVDDTAMVLMALMRCGILNNDERKERVGKAVNWLLGMQSSDGGWGAFDVDNNNLYLNDIPFADHGALLDPSTSDLTGRCLELLSLVGYGRDFPPIARGIKFLRRQQEECGAWFGRWGVNYIYGTWSVLTGLKQVGEDMSQPYIRKAVDWLKSRQNSDNGWGETCYSYNDPTLAGVGASTPSQTAWALLGLMAAGEAKSSAVRRGIEYLLSRQDAEGGWQETLFTGTGFPRVFYLRYHGYGQYFPLWALGVYQRMQAGEKTVEEKMRLLKPAGFHLPAAK